jgi:hypothetical protein
MSILVLGPEEKRQIKALMERAAANPVRWATIKDAALKIAERDDKRDLPLADRPPGIERPPSDHLMLGTVRVAYSVEEQPGGMCRHLSASVGRPGYLPDVHVMTALCEAFGFANFPPLTGRVWTEEFDPGHRAVNVVELIQEVGHA